MKTVSLFVLILVSAFVGLAQKPDDVAATATGHTFYYRDLPDTTRKWIDDITSQTRETRSRALDEMIDRRLLEMEARSTNTTPNALLAAERVKVTDPTEAEIKAVYDANRTQLGGQAMEAVREQLVNYLKAQAEQKLLEALIAKLRTKYKFVPGKDINSVGLSSSDVVASINGQNVTAKEFDDFARADLYSVRANLADQITDDLYNLITNALVVDEAKALGIEPGAVLASEITDKMHDYSDEERDMLNDALRRKLFAKYQVKILYKAPDPLVQNISVDDDPATGPANAPVTVVMFSDFQCPACSAFHPMLKKAMAAYPGKIRFVVRDYPLESRHEHAFRAAEAAGAANAQGKFFEYGEILYTHQDALDDESLRKYAAQLGLNAKQFEIDFNSEKTAAEIRHDIADGDAYGVNGTPTIFVNGISVRKYSVLGFRQAIDAALANSPK